MSKCKLCGNEKQLCDSHIIPEFLYKKLYDERHKIIAISGIGNKGFNKIQKGIREKLFCKVCENHLNLKIEIPFQLTCEKSLKLPIYWGPHKEYVRVTTDYKTLKLFHLSVLFRASVSSDSSFKYVDLGVKHESRMRDFILNLETGKSWQYPIIGFAIVHHETYNLVENIIDPGTKTKLNGSRVYGFIYGGLQWFVGVSSHKNNEFEKIRLRSGGEMMIARKFLNEVGTILDASKLLK